MTDTPAPNPSSHASDEAGALAAELRTCAPGCPVDAAAVMLRTADCLEALAAALTDREHELTLARAQAAWDAERSSARWAGLSARR